MHQRCGSRCLMETLKASYMCAPLAVAQMTPRQHHDIQAKWTSAAQKWQGALQLHSLMSMPFPMGSLPAPSSRIIVGGDKQLRFNSLEMKVLLPRKAFWATRRSCPQGTFQHDRKAKLLPLQFCPEAASCQRLGFQYHVLFTRSMQQSGQYLNGLS